jgi:hypothetical protein
VTPLNPDALTAGPGMDREVHTRVLGESLTYPHWILSTQERDCALFYGKTREAVQAWYDNLPPDSGTHRLLAGREPLISNEVPVPEYSTDIETALDLLLSRWSMPVRGTHLNGAAAHYLRSWKVEWLALRKLFLCTLCEGPEEVGRGAGNTVPEAIAKALLAEADGL